MSAPTSAGKRLAKSFLHFLGGQGLSVLLGLISFPILTRMLPQSDYGALGLATAMAAVGVTLAKGGISEAIVRFCAQNSADPDRFRTFASTVLARVLMSAVPIALLAATAAYLLTRHRTDNGAIVFVLMSLYVLPRTLNVVTTNFLRAMGNSLAWSLTTLASKTLSLLVSVGAMLLLAATVRNYSIGFLLAEVATASAMLVWLIRRADIRRWQYSPELAASMTKFGLPFMLYELANGSLEYIDRWMLVAWHGEATVAVYSVAASIPGYVADIALYSVAFAAVPIYIDLYERSGIEPTRALLSNALRLYSGAAILGVACYWLISQDLIVFLASAKYAEAGALSPVILLGKIFLGLNPLLYAGIYVSTRSSAMTATVIFAAIANVLLNLLLIPRFGALGAAIAISAASWVLLLSSALFSRKYLALHIDWGAILIYVAAAAIIVLAVGQIDMHATVPNLLVRGTLAGVLAAGVLVVRERTFVRQLLSLYKPKS
jgi:O-antigen/teichoic acid export membrane protein